jgi:hypothetical protein
MIIYNNIIKQKLIKGVHDVNFCYLYLYILKLRFSLSRRSRLRLCESPKYSIISYITIFIYKNIGNYSITNNYNR